VWGWSLSSVVGKKPGSAPGTQVKRMGDRGTVLAGMTPEKMTPVFMFLRHFRCPNGLKYVAKTGAAQRPLMAGSLGVNLPYSGKWGTIQAYFPQEPKRTVLQVFSSGARIKKRESGPKSGLFLLVWKTVPGDGWLQPFFMGKTPDTGT